MRALTLKRGSPRATLITSLRQFALRTRGCASSLNSLSRMSAGFAPDSFSCARPTRRRAFHAPASSSSEVSPVAPAGGSDEVEEEGEEEEEEEEEDASVEPSEDGGGVCVVVFSFPPPLACPSALFSDALHQSKSGSCTNTSIQAMIFVLFRPDRSAVKTRIMSLRRSPDAFNGSISPVNCGRPSDVFINGIK